MANAIYHYHGDPGHDCQGNSGRKKAFEAWAAIRVQAKRFPYPSGACPLSIRASRCGRRLPWGLLMKNRRAPRKTG